MSSQLISVKLTRYSLSAPLCPALGGGLRRPVPAVCGLNPKDLAKFPHMHLQIPSFSHKNSCNNSEENIMINGAL